jgi:hypothetical protein
MRQRQRRCATAAVLVALAIPIGTLFIGAAVASTIVWLAIRPCAGDATPIASAGSTALTVTGVDRDPAMSRTARESCRHNATQLLCASRCARAVRCDGAIWLPVRLSRWPVGRFRRNATR